MASSRVSSLKLQRSLSRRLTLQTSTHRPFSGVADVYEPSDGILKGTTVICSPPSVFVGLIVSFSHAIEITAHACSSSSIRAEPQWRTSSRVTFLSYASVLRSALDTCAHQLCALFLPLSVAVVGKSSMSASGLSLLPVFAVFSCTNICIWFPRNCVNLQSIQLVNRGDDLH